MEKESEEVDEEGKVEKRVKKEGSENVVKGKIRIRSTSLRVKERRGDEREENNWKLKECKKKKNVEKKGRRDGKEDWFKGKWLRKG